MAYRKLIGFGDNSFVVSLPKDWVTKNGLKKGEVLSLEEDGNFIKVSPLKTKQTNVDKEINIEFDGDLKKLKAEMAHVYIDNYNLINITGKDLFKNLKGIDACVGNFIALEVVQKNQQRISIKDFLNIHDISVHDTVRRMDRIVLSMAEDVRNYLLGNLNDVKDLVEQKEKDVNKLSNLIFKVLKKSFNPNDRAILKLNLNDVFYYWELTLFVEKVADQVKRIPRYIKPGDSQKLVAVFDGIMEQYSNAMKANFSNDYKLAIKVIINKLQGHKEADKLLTQLPVESFPSIEKMKNINSFAGDIISVFLKLKHE